MAEAGGYTQSLVLSSSAISSPCSSQTNPTTFPSTSVSSLQFKSPSPSHAYVCVHSALLLLLCPEIPTLCSSLIQAIQCFPCSDSQLQPICSHSQLSAPSFPLCSLLWSAPLSPPQKAFAGQLVFMGNFCLQGSHPSRRALQRQRCLLLGHT